MTDWVCLPARHPLQRRAERLDCPHCRVSYPQPEDIALFAPDPRALRQVQRSIPELEELWRLMEQHGSEGAADLLAEKYGRSRTRLSSDWKFFLPLAAESRVLELGAGLGEDTAELCDRAARVIAIVPTRTHALVLRRYLSEHRRGNADIAVMADISRLPLADHSVDAIAMDQAGATGFGVSAHSFSDIAAEWNRILTAQGSVLMALGNRAWRLGVLERLLARLRWRHHPAALNRWIKQVGAPAPAAPLSLTGVVRSMLRQGFGAPTLYAPLPNQERTEAVIPLQGRAATLYFLRNLVRRDSFTSRAAVAVAKLLAGKGLLRWLVPDYLVCFKREPNRRG